MRIKGSHKYPTFFTNKMKLTSKWQMFLLFWTQFILAESFAIGEKAGVPDDPFDLFYDALEGSKPSVRRVDVSPSAPFSGPIQDNGAVGTAELRQQQIISRQQQAAQPHVSTLPEVQHHNVPSPRKRETLRGRIMRQYYWDRKLNYKKPGTLERSMVNTRKTHTKPRPDYNEPKAVNSGEAVESIETADNDGDLPIPLKMNRLQSNLARIKNSGLVLRESMLRQEKDLLEAQIKKLKQQQLTEHQRLQLLKRQVLSQLESAGLPLPGEVRQPQYFSPVRQPVRLQRYPLPYQPPPRYIIPQVGLVQAASQPQRWHVLSNVKLRPALYRKQADSSIFRNDSSVQNAEPTSNDNSYADAAESAAQSSTPPVLFDILESAGSSAETEQLSSEYLQSNEMETLASEQNIVLDDDDDIDFKIDFGPIIDAIINREINKYDT